MEGELSPDSARVAGRAWATSVASETKTARILTWNNVVLQAITLDVR